MRGWFVCTVHAGGVPRAAIYDPRMDRLDLVVIGAGTAGEAATHYARSRGASVAVVDRALFGGSCPFWACMPSKALLHAAAVHRGGGDYPWARASAFRDYMINRERATEPDDSGHVSSLEGAGATVIRGSATLDGPGRVRVGDRVLEAKAVILAVGSVSRVPRDLPGLAEAEPWTNVEGTATRELPRSLVILGAGPTGVELAQVYARYGVPVTLVHPRDRVHDKEHRRSSDLLGAALEHEGVVLRLGARATRVRAGAGADGAHVVELSDGEPVEGHRILLAIGRDVPLDGLGLETVGVVPRDGRVEPDDHLRIADDLYVAGDVAGPEMHTHLGHYNGEAAARIALGDDYTPVLDAIPRATYTDPETASVGLLLEQARERGIDAGEWTADIGTSARGYTLEAQGHCTIVVDRAARRLVGAFLAGPAVSEAIHECVLAIRADIPLSVLADTIHAFPTAARVLGSAFTTAHRELDGPSR
jgi:pyruvate/2-oxoglutarate dehydrogenase complex dihydrolipoamide dehydrogenase (E3) component